MTERRRPLFRRFVCAGLSSLLFLLFPSFPGEAATVTERRETAVAQARNGEYDTAIVALAALRRRVPDDIAVLYDYIAVLGWMGHSQEVIDEARLLPAPAQCPAYVLLQVAQAARKMKDLRLADDCCAVLLARDLNNVEYLLLYTAILAESARYEEALAVLGKIKPADKALNLRLFLTKAWIYSLQSEDYDALAWYQKALELDPENREACRGVAVMLARVGATPVAWERYNARPDLFTQEERNWFRSARNGVLVSFGELTPERPEEPTKDAEHALTEVDKSLADPEFRKDTQFVGKTRFDRVIALFDTRRFHEACLEYESLKSDDAAIPDYALSAAAGSYLSLRRPEIAKAIYENILARSDIGAQVRYNASEGLLFSLVELNEYTKAQELAQKMEADEPVYLYYADGSPRANRRKRGADTLVGMTYMFADDLERAEKYTKNITDYAPANVGAMTLLSDIYRTRGLPRKALKYAELALVHDENDIGAQVARANALLALNEPEKAEPIIRRLKEIYPEHGGVRRLVRSWELQNKRELVAYAGFPRTDAGKISGRDEYEYDVAVYSQPFDVHWRVYAGLGYWTGDYPNDGYNDSETRYALGVQYRTRQLTLNARLSLNDIDKNRFAASVFGAWTIDDHWSIPFGFSSNSQEVPLAARRHGITGTGTELGFRYRWNELRSLYFLGKYVDFDDGNVRTAVQMGLHQRVMTTPNNKIDAWIDAYYAANTINPADAPYWAPKSQYEFGVTFDYSWRTWQKYEKSFTQHFIVGGGLFWQEDYGSEFVWRLGYQHEWNISEEFNLLYGYETVRRYYDGDPENQFRLYVRLWWRF